MLTNKRIIFNKASEPWIRMINVFLTQFMCGWHVFKIALEMSNIRLTEFVL